MAEQDDIRLSQFWDALVAGDPEAVDIEQSIADPLRHVHSLFAAPKPASARERARQRIFASETRSQESEMSALVLKPPIANGRSAVSPPVPFPAVRPVPKAPILSRRALLSLAAAMLIAFAGIGGYLADQRFFGDDPAPAVIPAIQATPTSDWPMYMGDPARTRVMPGTGPKSMPAEVWRVQLSDSASRSPAVAGDTAYVGSGDGILYALDANTGAERWQFQGDSSLEMTPTVLDGMVFVPSELGTLYAIDAATGTEKWRFAKPLSPFATPTYGDGLLFAGSEHDNHVYAIDPATGAEVWSFEATFVINRSQAYADGVVYSGSDNGVLYALNAQDGAELWRYDAVGYIPTPAIVDGVAYTTSTDGQVIMVDIATGQEVKRIAMESVEGVGLTPVVSDGIIYAGGYNGSVIALEVATGKTVWVSEPDPDLTRASLALVDGVVYGASNGSALRAFDAAIGAELWSYTLDGMMNHGPTIANGMVYASTDSGTVYAIGGQSEGTAEAPADVASESTFDASRVSFVWDLTTIGETTLQAPSPQVGPDGNLYVANLNNTTYILSPDGELIGQLDAAGSIGFDADGNIYVFNTASMRIKKFAPDHTLLTEWGGEGSDNGQFREEVEGTVDPVNGLVYATDFGNDRVQVFDLDGNFLDKWGSAGRGDGEFIQPVAAKVGPDGLIYVGDSGNRVQIFDRFGTFKGTLLDADGNQATISGAWGIAFDSAGNIYASDYFAHAIRVFDPQGREIGAIADVEGAGPFTYPIQLSIDADDNLYVGDFFGEGDFGRIVKLALPVAE